MIDYMCIDKINRINTVIQLSNMSHGLLAHYAKKAAISEAQQKVSYLKRRIKQMWPTRKINKESIQDAIYYLKMLQPLADIKIIED